MNNFACCILSVLKVLLGRFPLIEKIEEKKNKTFSGSQSRVHGCLEEHMGMCIG